MKISRFWCIGCLVALCLFLALDASGQSTNSCQLSGKVTYKGSSLPDGCTVMAFILGIKYAETEVKGGLYSLSVPADNPSTPEKDGWENGDFITLKVKDYAGGTPFKAQAGTYKQDINLITMGVLNLTTWGKIKALFK